MYILSHAQIAIISMGTIFYNYAYILTLLYNPVSSHIKFFMHITSRIEHYLLLHLDIKAVLDLVYIFIVSGQYIFVI
jgi:hypothetical protein